MTKSNTFRPSFGDIDDGLQTVTKTYYPSFTKVDREEDYRRAWEEFEKRYGE